MNYMKDGVISIAVIELNYHVEVLRNLCRILEGAEFKVTVFTKSILWNRVGEKAEDFTNLTVVEMPEDINLEQYFNQNLTLINQHDIVFFNTLALYHKQASSLDIRPPIILRVHNAIAELDPRRGVYFFDKKIFSTLAGFVKRVVIRKEWYYRERFLAKVSALMFPSQAIEEYVETERISKFLPIITPGLPLSFLEEGQVSEFETPKIEDKKTISIVVPGNVDSRRRRYSDLLQALQLAKSEFDKPVTITLLGQPKGKRGKRIQESFVAAFIGDNKISVRKFDSFVSDKEFSGTMKEASLLVFPINLNARYQIYNERYGKTKISGADADILKFQRPALMPEGYGVANELKPYVKHYNSVRHLSERLIEFVNDENHPLKNLTFSNLGSYEKEVVRERFYGQCRKLLQYKVGC